MYPKGLTTEQVLSSFKHFVSSLEQFYTLSDVQITEGKYSHSESFLRFKANGLQVYVRFSPMFIGMEDVRSEYYSATIGDFQLKRCALSEDLNFSLHTILRLKLNKKEPIDLDTVLFYKGKPAALRIKSVQGYSDIAFSSFKPYFKSDAFIELSNRVLKNLPREDLLEHEDLLVTKREQQRGIEVNHRGEDKEFVKFVARLLKSA